MPNPSPPNKKYDSYPLRGCTLASVHAAP